MRRMSRFELRERCNYRLQRGHRLSAFARLVSISLVAAGSAIAVVVLAARTQSIAEPAQQTLSCRVMESKTSSTLGVELVLFHQAEAASREQLGAFLD